MDCVKQILVAKRLCKELNGAGFHRADRHWNVTMARNENDRNRIA